MGLRTGGKIKDYSLVRCDIIVEESGHSYEPFPGVCLSYPVMLDQKDYEFDFGQYHQLSDSEAYIIPTSK